MEIELEAIKSREINNKAKMDTRNSWAPGQWQVKADGNRVSSLSGYATINKTYPKSLAASMAPLPERPKSKSTIFRNSMG